MVVRWAEQDIYVEKLQESDYENLGPNCNTFRNLTAFNCRMRASFSISFYAFDDSWWVMNGNGLKKINACGYEFSTWVDFRKKQVQKFLTFCLYITYTQFHFDSMYKIIKVED